MLMPVIAVRPVDMTVLFLTVIMPMVAIGTMDVALSGGGNTIGRTVRHLGHLGGRTAIELGRVLARRHLPHEYQIAAWRPSP